MIVGVFVGFYLIKRRRIKVPDEFNSIAKRFIFGDTRRTYGAICFSVGAMRLPNGATLIPNRAMHPTNGAMHSNNGATRFPIGAMRFVVGAVRGRCWLLGWPVFGVG